ncbi:class II fumarate hydratase [Phycisphaera mikurensis]|uniref:Fumarate hydratase class II n=1 Tax=Phycisphaera mikurensis (strain NBRC 102666 / KCTC 22515 / FYK2301M01) TaxID=1142394 RepID=I0IEK4_PHYMF|nr:class II fumarate hydratase [Phycisphaera mikurensis]MBB6441491.1 fumarate hydratase class II [Phycisphaera mikurensis]BAM03692.1 fumarate hydratase class II [Phycisphaera mikurensis NBRC 102666]
MSAPDDPIAASEGSTRTERDSMGEMQVPAQALYGASTARAVANFPIAHRPLAPAILHAFGELKAACAEVNLEAGLLEEDLARAIVAAAEEVARGEHDGHFPVDVYQTGSGTSTNMNANEVIANLANQKLGLPSSPGGDRDPNAKPRVHPNDHVNLGQSSNDTFPTAMHIAVSRQIHDRLVPALKKMTDRLAEQAMRWDGITKIGRTHVMDATPIRVGQVFSGYAEQGECAARFAMLALKSTNDGVPIGGTAVGTGINTLPGFGGKVCQKLSERTGLRFQEANNHFCAQSCKDEFVYAHGCLKTGAIALSKIASDIRLLGSGPRAGLAELNLPAIQPGSSIMPGKVNPVLCESVIQVACRVIGNDAAIATANLGGVGSLFELNVAMPVMADAFLESIDLLTNATLVFTEKLLDGLEVNEDRCRELLSRSLMTVTALAPELGYDVCSDLAKEAHRSDRTIKELVLERGLMEESALDEALDAEKMTRPG